MGRRVLARISSVVETAGAGALPTRLAAGSALLIVALGVTVLYGWWSNTPALVQVLPQLPAMTRNAAACFMLSGLALLTLALGAPRWLVIMCAGPAAAISILTLIEHIFAVNAGI